MSSKTPGSWYSKTCSLFKQKEDSSQRLVEEEKRHLGALQVLAAESPETEDSRRMKKHAVRLEEEHRKHEKNKRRIQQPGFTEAVEYLGMDIKPEQALAFASSTSGIMLFCLLMLYAFLVSFFPHMNDTLSKYMLPAAFALPLLLFAFLSSYPEMLAKRLRTASMGKTPEPINYMTMSLRTYPSLEKAVIFAGEHSGEPMASSLKRVVWEVMMRKYATIEDSLAVFAYQCGKWNEEMKRALYLIRGAVLENSKEGFERGLEKAHEVALAGAKEKVEDFASRLSGPATVLFALGVIMPMLVGAIVPLQGLQIPMGEELAEEPGNSVLPVILAMDVFFPLAAFLYAYNILGKRPGTIQPPEVEMEKRRGALSMAMVLGGLPLVLYVFPSSEPLAGGKLGHLPLLLSASFFLGTYMLLSTSRAYGERKRLLAMERDLPDALFQLGSRIAEGKPLETAFEVTASTMEGSPISPLFRDISVRMAMSRRTLDDVLFASDGILKDNNSRALQASMRSLIESVKKDPVTAGKTIIQTANYMKDLKKVDHDIRVKLQGVVDMMKATSIFFAPVVMGITVALYTILAEQFTMMGSQSMLAPMDFALVLGVFLFLSSLVSAYFVTGIAWGEDRLAFRRSVGLYVPVSMSIFCLAVIGGGLFIS